MSNPKERDFLAVNLNNLNPPSTSSLSPISPSYRGKSKLKDSLDSSSPRYSSFKQKRRWRWWIVLAVFFVFISIVEVVFFLINYRLTQNVNEPVNFEIKNYAKLSYQPLDKSTNISIPSDTTVYHITKEFGPATMGGMGTVLTALAQAQLKTKRIEPNIVLPHYSFLNKQTQYAIKKLVDLAITIHENGRVYSVPFRVSQFKYDFEPNDQFDRLSAEEKELYASLIHKKPTVMVYLIGFGKRFPFKKAFQARTITDIYSSPKDLPQEWKDQYFAKAASAFLFWRAAGKHEQSLFAPLHAEVRVDVVHLHGATNGYVAKYLREMEDAMGPATPSIVYTLHDYLDELQYTNSLANVEKFLNGKKGKALKLESRRSLLPYTFKSNRVFMSPMAIDLADTVTFVSESMARDMVEGRLDFYLKEVIMPNLLSKAQNGNFIGISNGLDFDLNPFSHGYPGYALELIQDRLRDPTRPWLLSSVYSDFVSQAKRDAKQVLIDHGWLTADDLERPLVLFIGRFQYNKGLETFEEASRLFELYNMKFAVVGQPNNYPLSWLERLANKRSIVLIKTVEEQQRWLVYFRMAADVVYVPSVTESFGLVAAEGLLFGSSVLSTGAGGLGEFLKDRNTERDLPQQVISESYVDSQYKYNAYLFKADVHGPMSLANAIQDLSYDLAHIKTKPYLHEEYVLRMMLSAYELGWVRPGLEQGPVYDYIRVYQHVIEERRRKSKFQI